MLTQEKDGSEIWISSEQFNQKIGNSILMQIYRVTMDPYIIPGEFSITDSLGLLTCDGSIFLSKLTGSHQFANINATPKKEAIKRLQYDIQKLHELPTEFSDIHPFVFDVSVLNTERDQLSLLANQLCQAASTEPVNKMISVQIPSIRATDYAETKDLFYSSILSKTFRQTGDSIEGWIRRTNLENGKIEFAKGTSSAVKKRIGTTFRRSTRNFANLLVSFNCKEKTVAPIQSISYTGENWVKSYDGKRYEARRVVPSSIGEIELLSACNLYANGNQN
jgi:hypothetical protein